MMPPPIDKTSRPPTTPLRPPVPPRPVARSTSRRKPVPVLSPFEQNEIQTSPSSTSTPSPPRLPPRTYQIQPAILAEKPQVIGFKKKKWRPYPESKRGKRWFWVIIGSVLLLIIVIAVVAALVTRKSKANTDNGGHPLSKADGGVDIGQPGDIAKYGSGSTDHFRIQFNRSTVVTRLDPIVSPGKLSAHVHRFYGSSLVDEQLHNASEMTNLAQCSTTAVQDDESIYWVPQLYHQSNGSFTMIPIRFHAAYYFQKAPTGVHLHPFPDNYNIVAGDPFRREVDPTDMSQKALWWICFRGGGNDTKTDGFPDTACPDGLIAIIVMPSCWDGIVASDGNYQPHVTYPTDAPNGHICPSDHPLKFMTVQFETNFAVGSFPFNGQKETWALANGDTTGLGIHANFVNGWKPGLQEQIIDKCRYMNKTDAFPEAKDIRNCPPLEPSIDYAKAWSCRFQGQIVDEEVGGNAPVTLLPGCNDLWGDLGDKPPCPAGRVEGGELEKVDPNVWIKEEPYV